MEEYSDLEHIAGSPTAGESGFVHVDPIDSASMDGSSINQDDGVVVTRVDDVQDESSNLRMTEDGGNEEFVDCPDDLLSYDGRSDIDESQEAEVVSEGQQHSLFDSQREILPHHYQEERQKLIKELTNLRHQLKTLIKKPPLIGESFTDETAQVTVVGDDKSLLPLHEMINDCSRFTELAFSQQSHTEGTIRELYATLDIKDREIEALNVKVIEHSSLQTTTDRILSSLSTIFREQEFPDTSFSSKLSHLEKSTSLLVKKYNHFLSEVSILNQCLTEVKSDSHMQTDMDKVLFFVREELLELKRKELQLVYRNTHMENEYMKMMQQLEKGRQTIQILNSEVGRLKGEVEVEKTRYSNTREKLNLAVTKGKSLVQQRDSLKQAIAEKTNELDTCLIQLQEKTSFYINLQDEVNRMEKAARVKIDGLTVSLIMEAQEKNYLEDEFQDLTHEKAKVFEDLTHEKAKFFDELHVVKDKNGSLQIDLQRSEDKSALLREKLSMAVKKGKGLVQERESMKLQIVEKNALIEALNLELKQKEETMNDCMDQMNKLESDLLHEKEERDEIEKFLIESNTMLQKVIGASGEILPPVDITEPVEKVKKCAAYLNEYSTTLKSLEDTVSHLQNNINLFESEIKKLKEEVAYHENKFMDASETIKTLEDDLLKANNIVSNLIGEKKKISTTIEGLQVELEKSKEQNDMLQNKVFKLETELEASQTLNDKMGEDYRVKEDEWIRIEAELSNQLIVKDHEAANDVLRASEVKSLFSKINGITIPFPNVAGDVELNASDPVKKLFYVVDSVNELVDQITMLSHAKQELHLISSKQAIEVENLKEKLEEAIKDKKEFDKMKKEVYEKGVSEVNRMEKAARVKIDGLTVSLIMEAQEKNYLEHEFQDLTHEKTKFFEELCLLKDKNGSLLIDLQRSEDKSAELREKLSMAVKKGKGLVQERESMKQQIVEKNGLIEALNLELKQQEAAMKDCRGQMNKLESDLLHSKEERDEIERFVIESNTMLQKVIEASDEIVLPVYIKEPVEKVKKCAVFLNEYSTTINSLEDRVSQLENNINLFESEVKKLKDEVSYHEHKFMDASETIKTLEDNLLKADNILGEKKNSEQEIFTKCEELQAELKKGKEQNDMLQNKVFNLETEVEASQTLNKKMGEDYRTKEDEWVRREAELSKQLIAKDHEAENDVLRASEVKSLFSKINGITIPFPNVEAGDVELNASDPVKKLFYIVESVNELVDQITLLSNAKQELHIFSSKQALEAVDLKEKLEEAIKDKKEFEKKKELYEKGVTEASSPLPPRSEISETEDPVSTGKRSMPVVPSAAHVRTLRKGSNDYLAININPESDKQETDEDKGHIFKSLHTSGLVPPQGKIIADRLDGIWVSGGRALMSRPRARVGLIAYWVVVHLWLLGTLL